MKISKVWDAADGSGTPGRVFTASINQELIVKNGDQLDFLMVGVKGAVSTAAVVIEDFADLVSPLTIRYGGDNRIILSLQELCALSKAYYGLTPSIGENTDATGNDFLGGIKVPIYQKLGEGKDMTIQADRNAITNIGTETVAITAYWDTGVGERKAIHCVRIAHTSSGSTGLETLGSRIVPQGRMVGLLVSYPGASGFTDTNIDTSIQRIKILADGNEVAHLNDLADAVDLGNVDYVTPAPLGDLLRMYRWFDFRPSGFDAKGQQLTLQIDVQDVSDAIVFMPVIEVE